MPDDVFTTDRFLVRRWRESDLRRLVEVYGEAETMKWVGDGRPLNESDCRKWLAVTRLNYESRGYGMFAVQLKGQSLAIGFSGIVHPGNQQEAEVKYAYLRPFWGQGIATEVLQEMLSYGAKRHGIASFMATTAPENIASHRVLMKAGFTPNPLERDSDGKLTQSFFCHGATVARKLTQTGNR